jgi:RNA polymerase sigma-70 factor
MMLAYDEASAWGKARSDARMTSVPPLRERIAEQWRSLQALDGDLGVPVEAFVQHVTGALDDRAAASGPDADPARILDQLVLRDVYLVIGCLRGHPAALRLFEKRYGNYLRKLARDYTPCPDLVEDVEAEMLCTMFQPRDGAGSEARLAHYQGMGSLSGWMRVAVRRLAIDLCRSKAMRPTAQADDNDRLVSIETPHDPVDERLADDQAVAHVSAALGECIQELPPEQRELMRLYYRDGFVLRELAEREGCDIASVHRRLAAIRKRVWSGLKRRAEQRLGLDERDLRQLVGHLAESLQFDELFAACLVLLGPLGRSRFGAL